MGHIFKIDVEIDLQEKKFIWIGKKGSKKINVKFNKRLLGPRVKGNGRIRVASQHIRRRKSHFGEGVVKTCDRVISSKRSSNGSVLTCPGEPSEESF